jgi:REP element-mobilizing transposase RayT
MWNNTETPLAYLITFRTYGTWLHGDERGSTDRHNNIYGTPHIELNDNWHRFAQQKMSGDAFVMNSHQRRVVKQAIKETCIKRGWDLDAASVRTNHAHGVVSRAKKGDLVLNALKANATRCLRQNGLWLLDHSPWADKGSVRRLWNEQSVANAVKYVLHGQGGPLPDLD